MELGGLFEAVVLDEVLEGILVRSVIERVRDSVLGMEVIIKVLAFDAVLLDEILSGGLRVIVLTGAAEVPDVSPSVVMAGTTDVSPAVVMAGTTDVSPAVVMAETPDVSPAVVMADRTEVISFVVIVETCSEDRVDKMDCNVIVVVVEYIQFAMSHVDVKSGAFVAMGKLGAVILVLIVKFT